MRRVYLAYCYAASTLADGEKKTALVLPFREACVPSVRRGGTGSMIVVDERFVDAARSFTTDAHQT